MARVSKKDVYARITDKKEEIKQTEEQLAKLNEELKVLYQEQDELEMSRMLEAIRNQGIDIETALAKLLSEKNK